MNYTPGNVSWICSARLGLESSFQLSRVILNPLSSSFPKGPEHFTGHRGLMSDFFFLFPFELYDYLHVHCMSVTTVHQYLCYEDVSCFCWGCRNRLRLFFFLNTKYNVMFIPYLLYKKTTTRWCTFCLRYCTWERFVSNGWAFQAPWTSAGTQTQTWHSDEKRDRLLTDRIQQGYIYIYKYI